MNKCQPLRRGPAAPGLPGEGTPAASPDGAESEDRPENFYAS